MASAIESLPPAPTRYRILRPLARGRLGSVLPARDEELNRDVALERMHGDLAKGTWGRPRLLFEAEVIAGPEHPGVVPVYGRGEDGCGRPCFTMRYLRGENLSEAADAHPGDAPPRATLRRWGRLKAS